VTKTVKRPRLWAAALVLWAAVPIACVVSTRPINRPAQIPGAEFVGSPACLKCHGNIARGFHDATHSRLVQKLDDGSERSVGCESCHGGGSRHIKAGTRETILNPKVSPETCLQCHVNTRAEFSLPHTHAVLSGKISCSSCHDPHQGAAVGGGARSLQSNTDAICAKCHQAQTGPYAFEHEAMREGCVSCHSPHGSVNDKMLKARNVSLCYQCHFQPQTSDTSILHGGVNHSGNVIRGTCWSAGCHEAIHGSQVNSSLRY